MIDLGCGPQNKPDCVHVDNIGSKKYYPHVDYEIDLNERNWEYQLREDAENEDFMRMMVFGVKLPQFDIIYAEDIVEHVDGLVDFLNSCWSISAPNAHLFIRTPSYDADFAHIDPTHKHLYHLDTFDFFDPSTPYGKYNIQLTPYKWKVISKKLTENRNIEVELEKIG